MRKFIHLGVTLLICFALTACENFPPSNVDDYTSNDEKNTLDEDIYTNEIINGIKIPKDNEKAWDAAGYVPGAYYYWKTHKDTGTHDPDVEEAKRRGGREVLSDEFIISSEFPSYSKNVDEIRVYLKSVKPTSELKLYQKNNLPRIEKLVNGEWQRLLYMPGSYFIYGEWGIKNFELADTEYQIDSSVVRTENLFTPLVPGRYRIIIYLGSTLTPFTAEFDISE